ncbi:MAG: PepSY domain-containing protein [Duncaniella sp.]|nr:PepSY domain-containing protein [Duncaniella sp.]
MAKNNKLNWKSFHKWAGVILTVFILLFCVSGVILNHRAAFSGCDISRSLLPDSYRLNRYNNGSVKGTLPLDSNKVLVFGNVGAWLSDRQFSEFTDFNAGFPKGIDNRNIRNVVQDRDGHIWAAAQFGLFSHCDDTWTEVPLPGNDERLSDITLSPDSAQLIVLTRSAVYTLPLDNSSIPVRKELKALDNYKPEITLFKTVWQLHSGELFGMAGRVIVDIIAIIIVILGTTGIIIFLLPYTIHHSKRENAKKEASCMKWNLKWHNRIGFYTIILTVLIAFTGMCLRPPLMIPFVLVKTAPIPGTTLDSDNAWHDKLRGIRWDSASGKWLISTSEGFIKINPDFSDTPEAITSATPPVSPMGITVMEETAPGQWLIGSFSGLFHWNEKSGEVIDQTTGKPYQPSRRGMALASTLVSGHTTDLKDGTPIVFDYSKGAPELPPMHEEMARQPMSLWNAALELHVGRCYSPFLGPFSELFVFVSGLLLTLILISGLIVYCRHHKSTKKQINK